MKGEIGVETYLCLRVVQELTHPAGEVLYSFNAGPGSLWMRRAKHWRGPPAATARGLHLTEITRRVMLGKEVYLKRDILVKDGVEAVYAGKNGGFNNPDVVKAFQLYKDFAAL